MPVSDGLLESQPVKVLRDSDCSTVVVRRSLVPEDKLTGQEERCILIDGTVRRTPVAEIFIDTPYYTGKTTAVCMKNPLYDLIIGNITKAADPSTTTSPLPASAVQTRGQLKATKGQSELVTPIVDLGSEDVASLQTEDPSFEKAMAAAKDRNDYQFQIQKGFLYQTSLTNKVKLSSSLLCRRHCANES